jgi:hypothetical protein
MPEASADLRTPPGTGAAETLWRRRHRTTLEPVGRRWALAAVAALVAVSISAAAWQTNWKSLPYFHYDLSGSELYLSTSKAWHGHVVEPLTDFPLGLVPQWALAAQRAPQPLWLSTCTTKAQVAHFSFPFEAPGPAETASVVIASAAAGAPIDSVVVTVNGLEVARSDRFLRTRGYTEVKLDASDLKRFKHGGNTIAIRATKPALPKVVKACNTANDSTFDKRRVSVAVGLRATFEADMRAEPVSVFQGYKVVTTGERSRRVYLKATPGRTLVVNSNFKIRNAGPAASVGGIVIADFRGDTSLKLLVAGGEGTAIPLPGGQEPYGKCKIENQNPFRFVTVTCPYADFPPKKDIPLKMTWVVKVDQQLAANFSQRVATVDYRVGGVDDEGTLNANARLEIYFCGKFASEPGCKNAQ